MRTHTNLLQVETKDGVEKDAEKPVKKRLKYCVLARRSLGHEQKPEQNDHFRDTGADEEL